jgi:pimeloyl-ACP methyl ester carboxylesterase
MTQQHSFTSFDGQTIAYHTLGEGRPTLLLHGFMASTQLNWTGPGITAKIAALGRKVIALDFRGHGASAPFNGEADFPPDVLSMDVEASLGHLGLSDVDLVGYSMGARTAVRLLIRGFRPGKLVMGGMGDTGATTIGNRMAFFEDSLLKGEQAANPAAGKRMAAMLAAQGLSPLSMLKVLKSQLPVDPAALATIPTPILILNGAADEDNGSPEGLAKLFPHAKAKRVQGDHLTAIGDPALGDLTCEFLGAG